MIPDLLLRFHAAHSLPVMIRTLQQATIDLKSAIFAGEKMGCYGVAAAQASLLIRRRGTIRNSCRRIKAGFPYPQKCYAGIHRSVFCNDPSGNIRNFSLPALLPLIKE